MKIVQVMPEFGLAGAERMAEALTLELIRKGHDVKIISLYDYHSAITDNLERKDVQIFYLNKKTGLDLSMVLKLVRILRKIKPDVVHTHRYVCEYVIPAAILANVKKRVHTVHNMADKESLPKLLQKFFYYNCHVTPVSISPRVQESIQNYYHLKQSQIPMVFNGIDLKCCKNKKTYEKKDRLNFLHVGRFSEQKNHMCLLEAFERFHKKYSDTTLTMVGQGILFEEVSKAVEQKKLTDAVFLLGQINDILSKYENYDVFVLPSKYEGMPITLIEAMGCGMPIIATDVGGVSDMICNEISGLLCYPEVDSIINAMEKMYLDEELRKSLGIQARNRAQIFSVENMAKEYIAVYQQL